MNIMTGHYNAPMSQVTYIFTVIKPPYRRHLEVDSEYEYVFFLNNYQF